jgi:hypothetical protein
MPSHPNLIPLGDPGAIRIRAIYRSAGTLLRELSRALGRGHTVLKADSGLPVGTRLELVLVAEALREPIEVSGTITASRLRGTRYAIGLRYDFDPGPHRARIAEAIAALRRETRVPRRDPRVPLAIGVDAHGLEATLVNVSRGGGQLELSGKRLPALAMGSRILLSLAGSRPGTRAARRLTFEVRWTGAVVGEGRRRRILVGGRFLDLSPALRERIRAILRFDDFRPRIRIRQTSAPASGGKPR